MSEAQAEPNRRRYPRIPVTLEIRCAVGSAPTTFVTRDLSAGGLSIFATQVFPLGTELALQCKLPYAHGELKLKGRVVRHEPDPQSGLVRGMGIEFSDLTATQRQTLESYLQNTVGPAAH